jgi:hypothetical protein
MTDAASQTQQRSSVGRRVRVRPYWLVLAAILIVAAGLRAYRLGAESFWIDELYMLEYTAGHCHADFQLPTDRVIDPPPRLSSLDRAVPVWKVPTTLRDDQHPPVYYVLLRLWRDAFGSSEAAMRSLSLVASLLAIVVLFDVGRLLFSTGVALWACALMAVAQAEIRYGQEARSYMLLTLFVLLAADALLRVERDGLSVRRGLALAAAMLAVVLTHYYGVAGCVALGAYVLIRFRGPLRTRTLGVMAAAAVVFAVAWGPFFLQQMHGYAIHSDWLDVEPGGPYPPLVAWGLRLLNAPIRFFAEPSFRHPGPLPMIVGLVLVLPLLRVRRIPSLLLPGLWTVTWFGMIAAIDLARSTHQMDFTRYLLGASPAVYLSAAGLLSDRRGWVRHVIPAAFVLYCVTSLPWTYDAPKPEWRRLGQDFGRHATDDDLVLYYTASGRDWYSGVMYLATEYYAPQLRVPTVVVTRPLTADVLARARAARTVWLATDSATPDIPRLVPGFHAVRSTFCWGVGFLNQLTLDAPAATTAPSHPGGGTGTSSTPTTRGT